MAVRIVRLGSARVPGEGLRIGTVRRPPRGVPKSEFSAEVVGTSTPVNARVCSGPWKLCTKLTPAMA